MPIHITKLHFSYPTSTACLFEDFSLQIQEGWTCVAGSNGCGKSTLLKLLAGILRPDGGSISCAPDGGHAEAAVYCPQETAEMPDNLYTAFWSDDNEARKFFSRLRVTEAMLERYDSLSGGEKKRIQIACALAEHPPVLLLDEPTNHLDGRTSGMICEALKEYTGCGIIVSHDRGFADSLCTRTVYLYNEARTFAGGRDCIACATYPGGLSKALELRRAGLEQSRGDWEKLNAKAAGERQRSARLEAENQKAKGRLSKKTVDPHDHDTQAKIDAARISGKDRSSGDAKARLESQIRQTEAARDGIKKSLQRKEGFSVAGTEFSKPLVIQAGELTAGSYTLSIPHIELKRGDKIALTGENGTGKTLFIRHVISLVEQSGRTGEVLYLPQELSAADTEAIVSDFSGLDEGERGEVLSTLYRLGSEPDRLQQLKNPAGSKEAAHIDLPALSPGELRKLVIALAVQRPLSLLILDEPTNHMDITSVLALEDALAPLDCAMLIVSHDQAFLQKTTNAQLVTVRDGDRGDLRKM